MLYETTFKNSLLRFLTGIVPTDRNYELVPDGSKVLFHRWLIGLGILKAKMPKQSLISSVLDLIKILLNLTLNTLTQVQKKQLIIMNENCSNTSVNAFMKARSKSNTQVQARDM